MHSWVECAQFLPKDKRSVLYLWLSDAYCGWCPLSLPTCGSACLACQLPTELSRSAPRRVEQARAAQAHGTGTAQAAPQAHDGGMSRRARQRWPIKERGWLRLFTGEPKRRVGVPKSMNFKAFCEFPIKMRTAIFLQGKAQFFLQ